MINKPGTLLIVRKEAKSRHDRRWPGDVGRLGIHHIFAIDREAYPDKYSDNPGALYWPEWIHLPYGSAVMLLGMEAAERPGRKNLMKMRVLHGDTYLVGELSKNQINKWFTYPNVWKARKKTTKTDT